MFWLWLVALIISCLHALQKTRLFFNKAPEKVPEATGWLIFVTYVLIGLPFLGIIPLTLWLLKP